RQLAFRRQPTIRGLFEEGPLINSFTTRNREWRGAEFDSSAECPPLPWRSYAIVAFLPVANPRKIGTPEDVDHHQTLLWIARADESNVQFWIEQLCCGVSESPLRRSSQVGGSVLLGGRLGPGELGLRLQKNTVAITCRTDFPASRRHVEQGCTTFQKRRTEGYVLIPANRTIITA